MLALPAASDRGTLIAFEQSAPALSRGFSEPSRQAVVYRAPKELGTMAIQPTSLERAFQLARSGQFSSLEHIRLQLNREGLNPRMVVGPVLRKQLRDLICDAHLKSVVACG